VPQLSAIHPSWTNLGFGIVFIMLGLVGMISAAVSTLRAFIARGWPTVSGTVIKARVATHKRYRHSRTYRPMVTYEYQVGTDRFTADTFSYGNWNASWRHDEAQQKVGGYAAGDGVTVHYNPRKPVESILEPQAGIAWQIAIAGLVAIAVGIVSLVGVISLG
jgi:hypothetical protein